MIIVSNSIYRTLNSSTLDFSQNESDNNQEILEKIIEYEEKNRRISNDTSGLKGWHVGIIIYIFAMLLIAVYRITKCYLQRKHASQVALKSKPTTPEDMELNIL